MDAGCCQCEVLTTKLYRMEHIRETAYWAGRLIGYDQAWEVAEEIVEAIKYAESQALQQPDVSGWCLPKLEATQLDMNDPKIKKILEDTQKAIAGSIESANRSIRIGR